MNNKRASNQPGYIFKIYNQKIRKYCLADGIKKGGPTYIHTYSKPQLSRVPFHSVSVPFRFRKIHIQYGHVGTANSKEPPPPPPFFCFFFIFIYMYGTVRYVRSFNYSPNKNKKKTPRNHLPTLPTYLDHFNQSSPFPPPPSPPTNIYIHTYIPTHPSIHPTDRPNPQRTSL